MQLLSYAFIILWMICFALYYLVPVKWQRYVLLAAGVVFYTIGLKGIPFGLIFTGITTYACGLYLKKNLEAQKEAAAQCADKEAKKALRAAFAEKRKRVQILYVILNLGLLVFYKYAVAAVPFLQDTLHVRADFLGEIIMPLGISFYTLTAIGYMIDVGRENCAPETDFWHILLFLSYFPSVTQGPFNRYVPMKEQFDREHTFDDTRMLRGIQRFVWGAFKKLVIADRLGIFVDNVFAGDTAVTAGSVYFCAVIFYMLQLYTDFSGYIDMASGVSETFDIMLPENFKRPYFAKSVAEFWRRWHITLGTWFKDYVMFSFVMSGPGRKVGKACKKRWTRLGKHIVPVIGTMLVWFFTGIWHGRTISYMLWGVYYGIIMSASLILEPQYERMKSRLHIKDGKGYDLFSMVRTWGIVFLADILIRSESMAQAGRILQAFFTRFHVRAVLSGTVTSYGLGKYDLLLLAAALLILLAVSVMEERGVDVRTYLASKPAPVKWLCYYSIVLLLLITGIYGGNYDTAAFMYQSF